MGPSQHKRKEEDAVKAFLSDALSGEQPKSGVWEFASTLKPKRRLLRLGFVTGAFAAILALLLRIPAGIKVLASCPVVGGPFSRCLQAFAGDLAYQAGLTQELNRTQVVDGIRITVVGARSEVDGTTVFYTLSPEPGQESESWSRIRDHSLQINQYLVASRNAEPNVVPSSYWFFSSREDCVYGMVRGAPLGVLANLLGGKITLEVQAREAHPLTNTPAGPVAAALGQTAVEWRLEVPTQSTDASEQRVAVDKTVMDAGNQIKVTEVAFSCVRTVLRYEVSRGSDAQAKGVDTPIPLPWALLGECFALETGDGADIPVVGCKSLMEDASGSTGQGEVYFLPTHQSDLRIIFRPLRVEPASTASLGEPSDQQVNDWILHEGEATAVAGIRKGDGDTRVALGSSAVLPPRLNISPLYVLDLAGSSVFELGR